jgi:hypothetical protein
MDLGDDDDEPFRRQCEVCKKWSPPTKTQHTLISTKLGWRLSRHTMPDGKVRVEWRCPECHAKTRTSRPDWDPKKE